MKINGHLEFNVEISKILIDTDIPMAQQFIQHLPLISVANNIGGEIYFRVPGVDLQYDGTEKEEFKVGDIVYWRSPMGEDKYAIAIFFGNTSYSNWKSPRASSLCIKIGEIIDGLAGLELVETGEFVKLWIE